MAISNCCSFYSILRKYSEAFLEFDDYLNYHLLRFYEYLFVEGKTDILDDKDRRRINRRMVRGEELQ